jgi:hypothetical protein
MLTFQRYSCYKGVKAQHINQQETSLKITLCILVILCDGVKHQMIENLNKLTEDA